MNAGRRADDVAQARERLDAIYEKVRRSFAENLSTIDAATDHLATGALDDVERTAAERAAHRLVGAVAMVGFPDATEPARRLERAFASDGLRCAEVARMQSDATALRALLDRHPVDC